MSGRLSAADIRGLLGDLAAALDRRGIQGELFLVGGAAMALAYDSRRATRDIDAVFEPKQSIYAVAGDIAEDRGLAPDWLNDAVKGFLHGPDPAARPVFERPGLRVDAASPRYLLAMKLLAAREDDIDDIRTLYQLSGLTTVEQGVQVLQAAYPGRVIPPRVRYLLEELFSPGGPAGGTPGGSGERDG